MLSLPLFHRYIGINYSGAQTPAASLKGLRIYIADRTSSAVEMPPSPSPRHYWTRRGIAEWLVARLSDGPPILVGIDHGFSFPMKYFEKFGVPKDWPMFLDDFQRHWPTDDDHTYVCFVSEGIRGNGAARWGQRKWLRLIEKRMGSGKSLFNFEVPGSRAAATHAGLPWLRYLRQKLPGKIHCWPFDGWEIPAGKSVLVEVSPALWNRSFPRQGRTANQQDAYAVAERMRRADGEGRLGEFFKPPLTPDERRIAQVEGWILGVI